MTTATKAQSQRRCGRKRIFRDRVNVTVRLDRSLVNIYANFAGTWKISPLIRTAITAYSRRRCDDDLCEHRGDEYRVGQHRRVRVRIGMERDEREWLHRIRRNESASDYIRSAMEWYVVSLLRKRYAGVNPSLN